jgi:CheY-like chemotaxis protein
VRFPGRERSGESLCTGFLGIAAQYGDCAPHKSLRRLPPRALARANHKFPKVRSDDWAGPCACAAAYVRESDAMPTPILLLVEDEAVVQEWMHTELVDAGFELVAAADGTQALAELEADAERFKAVITDIKLGEGPDGWNVGRRARELVADMPVVYVSGDSADEWTSKGVPHSVMIMKPFVAAQLITAVSTLITDADVHRAD